METNPTKRTPGWTIASALLLAINVPGFVLLMILTTLSGGMAIEMYRGLGIKKEVLPQITKVMLYTISPSAYLGIFGAITVGLLAKEFLIRNKLTAIKINIAAFAFMLIFPIIYVFALQYPMMRTMWSMAAPS